MRAILFRGKRVDNGEWVYGTLIQRNIWGDVWEVIPETVGQYTGLKDKNGIKIFGGDILDCGDRIVRVEWNRPNGCWDSVFIKYTMDEHVTSGVFPVEWKYRTTVIGNVTDNPELMEWE